MRKIIAICALKKRSVIAVCDDGTVWEGICSPSSSFAWHALPNIPAPDPSVVATGKGGGFWGGGGGGAGYYSGENGAGGGGTPDWRGVGECRLRYLNATEQVVDGGAFINLTKLREESK